MVACSCHQRMPSSKKKTTLNSFHPRQEISSLLSQVKSWELDALVPASANCMPDTQAAALMMKCSAGWHVDQLQISPAQKALNLNASTPRTALNGMIAILIAQLAFQLASISLNQIHQPFSQPRTQLLTQQRHHHLLQLVHQQISQQMQQVLQHLVHI